MTNKRRFLSAKTVVIANQKGGCGKTMLTMQLAGWAALNGYRTLVIDLDPQQTASTWFSVAEARETPFPANLIALKQDPSHLIGVLRNFKDDYDLIFIDCPPSADTEVPWTALLSADLGIIPVIPTLDNIWASQAAFKLAEEAHKKNPDLQMHYVLNNMRRGVVYDMCKQSITELPAVNSGFISKLGDDIMQRNAYPECQVYGTVLNKLKGCPKSALLEIESVGKALIKELKKGENNVQ